MLYQSKPSYTTGLAGKHHYLLSLHQLLAFQSFVPFVCTTNPGTVDAPTLLCVIALPGLEATIALTLGVVDAVVVYEGGLIWLAAKCTG